MVGACSARFVVCVVAWRKRGVRHGNPLLCSSWLFEIPGIKVSKLQHTFQLVFKRQALFGGGGGAAAHSRVRTHPLIMNVVTVVYPPIRDLGQTRRVPVQSALRSSARYQAGCQALAVALLAVRCALGFGGRW